MLAHIKGVFFYLEIQKKSFKQSIFDKCDYITRLRLVLQTHTRQKTFHRTRSVMYYYIYFTLPILPTILTTRHSLSHCSQRSLAAFLEVNMLI